ncbi:MAG: ABC transporter permease [Proteobacteria bacterium]|nr:ABC transporter permease [Pseudomonadota bacterium]
MSAGRLALWLYGGAIVAFLCLPIAIVAAVSFGPSVIVHFPPAGFSWRWYANYVGSGPWLAATWLSVELGIAVAAAATALGTFAAIAIVRGQFLGRRAVEFLLISPMVAPTIVLALGLYLLLAPWKLVGTPIALFLAHTLVAMPIVVVIAGAALKRTDASMELAARSLGAGFWRTLWYVTLPTIRPALVSSAAFAFLTSFDEVVLAIFLGGPGAATLPKRMWEGIKNELDPTLTAVSTILVVVSLAALAVVELSRRGERSRQA